MEDQLSVLHGILAIHETGFADKSADAGSEWSTEYINQGGMWVS